MTLLHDDRPDLGASVRLALQHLAADVHATPPPWEELIERPEAVVLPLAAARPGAAEVRERPRRERRPRLGAIAAAALVLALAAALVVDRTGGGPRSESPEARTISAVVPGAPGFDASTAAAVWATRSPDPVQAARAYLGAMGLPSGATAASAPAVALRGTAGTTAVVDWSLPAALGGARGSVYLRSSAAAGAPATWTVVGSAASDMALADVRYDGSTLSFTVSRTSAGAEQLAVGAWVDGRPVSLGGDPVAQAGAAGVSLGDLVSLASGAGARQTLTLRAAADDIVTLRVVHVVDGAVRSLTQMAVALPDADPAAVAAGIPATRAGADAGGQVDAGAAGASGRAGADAGATAGSGGAEAHGSGGVDLAPGVTVPKLPALPPLPLPPVTVPNVPAPALPVPTTLPASVNDHLP
jgi:hypothetical protein